MDLRSDIIDFLEGSCSSLEYTARLFDISEEELVALVSNELDWCVECGWCFLLHDLHEEAGELSCKDCLEEYGV